MLNPRFKALFYLKKILKYIKKGGDEEMSTFREKIIETIHRLLANTIPIATAREISRAGDRFVRDKREDCRMFELGIQDQDLREGLAAMKKALS